MTSYNWLAGIYDKLTFTAFDTETTGLDPVENRIIEIGAVKFDCRGAIARFNVLINPEIPIPIEATKINNITDAMVRDKPTIGQIFPDFFSFIQNTVLVAHNAKFDIDFINAALARLDKTSLTHRVVDTHTFAREVFPGLRSYALQNLAQDFGIAAKEAHRAEDDARVCMDFFMYMTQHFITQNPELVQRMQADINANAFMRTEKPQDTENKYAQSLF